MLQNDPLLAIAVLDGCLRSVSYKTMASEVLATYQVQNSLFETLKNVDLDDNKLTMLQDLAKRCRDILSEMNEELNREKKQKGNTDATRVKLEELRNSLGTFTTLLNSLYTSTVLQ
jgi:hypothetical protein